MKEKSLTNSERKKIAKKIIAWETQYRNNELTQLEYERKITKMLVNVKTFEDFVAIDDIVMNHMNNTIDN